MAQLFLVPIDLGNNEIRNVLLQQLASDPSPLEALIYYNTTSHEVRYYNGTAWVSLTAGGGSVTAVTGTAPIVSSGGSTPAISITAATGSAPGSMSAADKTKLDAATSSPSASTLALRDGSGRMQAATPSAGNDVTNASGRLQHWRYDPEEPFVLRIRGNRLPRSWLDDDQRYRSCGRNGLASVYNVHRARRGRRR
jgi:hypothetical protein